eukprot:CAMPEP_0194316360 /NCGR_PEP_ID=MMETSP0171-20130528/13159_1 /TAXON_ID=218684 /ORGANISM="Corethron pennatum, Strain L29A3" /LENGTH=304 /DNA_ID=CAMNT_0039072563 /DNA_START=147 /DNA_END=1061 /DNA_ORIENTATION=+
MAAIEDPRGVPPNYIIGALPPDLLKMTFRALPASNRFVSPVCRHFRDLYGAAVKDKEKTNRTYEYSIATEAALELYLEEAECGGSRNSSRTSSYQTSMIGAGCGRTDWVERGGVFETFTCEAAAKHGQWRVLKWLRGRDCPWNERTCRLAARAGHLKMLMWLKEEGCPEDERSCMMAARGGHLEVLMWLIKEGCPLGREMCEEAAHGGHLKVLMWLKEEGCPWDERTCAQAARGGHLEVLMWLREEGCPWDDETALKATIKKHFILLKWAVENGCLTDPDIVEYFEELMSSETFLNSEELRGQV